ncbi:hypothetical protein GQF42_16760 [Streptomyces broussonetiae]|uniref:Uncharacterized protein n=1 Tax=Streptomyces broussonetiae TaxID=2686304 RepID=A0A6I6N002_9ACTN|nr:hypothetical protein GQF42_16760 [Streptomyces broussonetiae]
MGVRIEIEGDTVTLASTDRHRDRSAAEFSDLYH